MSVLISAVQLHHQLAAGDPVRLLDVRWRPGPWFGQADYVTGHLPDATYVDLESDLAFGGSSTDGRRPLPPIDYLQLAVRRWGINPGDTVVVYDDDNGLGASRAWWVLRHAGLTDVRILDGGVAAWRAAGGNLEAGTPAVTPGTAQVTYGALPLVTAGQLLEFTADTSVVIVDTRRRADYLGQSSPADPRAGHVPGAVSIPAEQTHGTGGAFLPADVLLERFTLLGITPEIPVIVYSDSGISAARTIAALTVAGYHASLYASSWSQWSLEPTLPVERLENIRAPRDAASITPIIHAAARATAAAEAVGSSVGSAVVAPVVAVKKAALAAQSIPVLLAS